MSSLHQNCPGCGRTLELPAEASGRLGKCPACEATFTIGETSDAEKSSPLESAAQPTAAPQPAAPPAQPIDSSLITSPPNQAAIDTSVTSPDAAYQPQPLRITQSAIEDVLSTTTAIFRRRWAPCVGSLAIVVAATLLLIVLPMVILDAINNAGGRALAVIGYLLMLPVMFVVQASCGVGMARVALAVARGEPSPLANIISPPILILRAMGVSLLLSLVTGGLGVMAFSFIAIIDATGAKVLARLFSIVAALGGLAFGYALFWQLWAWLFVCADDKGTTIGSIRAAQAITSQNKLTSFFLVLIAVILSLLGTLLCLVGHIVTAPLTVLLFAVAYLMMTGQGVSRPKEISVLW